MIPTRALLVPVIAALTLGLAGCLPTGPRVDAELVLEVQVAEGGTPTPEALDAVATVVVGRLTEAGIAPLDAVRRDGRVVVRFGEDTTDADLDAAQRIATFSSHAAFRPVLVTGQSTATTLDVGDPASAPTDASDLAWVTADVAREFITTDCRVPAPEPSVADLPLVACQDDDSAKYVLGPVVIDGSTLAGATPARVEGSGGSTTDDWTVTLEFDADGSRALGEVTTRLVGLESPRNQFAVVLDGEVLIAPAVNAAITDGRPQISGGFDERDAHVLAGRFVLSALGAEVRVDLINQMGY